MIITPDSDAIFGGGLVLGAACSGILQSIGDQVTKGWVKAYPARQDLGLLLWLFDEWGHRPIRFAAHQLGLPARPWVAAHYSSVGVLVLGLLVLLGRIVLQH